MTTLVGSIGVFDGVHRGHRAVLTRARERADAAAARLVVCTFEVHPRVVLGGTASPPLMTPPAEKAARLREAGADEVRFLKFSSRLADKSAARFLGEHLFPYGRLAALVVGYDFAMGRDRSGDQAALRDLGRRFGFTVLRVAPDVDAGRPVSSSRVREALVSGDVGEAARLLDRPYSLTGRVVTGEGRGRILGFPTANLVLPGTKLRPARGVYAVTVRGCGPAPIPGVMNLGRRPTFDGRDESVEVHLLGFSGDLLGTRLDVDLVERLRQERKFHDASELTDQIERDVEAARRVLGTAPAAADNSGC
jgi:riboflavin kinase/FMN adenylyltransferase